MSSPKKLASSQRLINISGALMVGQLPDASFPGSSHNHVNQNKSQVGRGAGDGVSSAVHIEVA